MKRRSQPTSDGRRNVLRTLGLASGAAVAAPVVPAAAGRTIAGAVGGFSDTRSALNVGVLLPVSASSENLLAGMNLAFRTLGYRAGGRNIAIITAPIGPGGSGMYRQSAHLLADDPVDLAVGLVNPRTTYLHTPLYEKKRIPFIETSMGERISADTGASRYVLHNTFGCWQSCLALGTWSAASIGRRAVIAGSRYESGFDTHYAFRAGFERGGGRVVAAFIDADPETPVDADTMIGNIASLRPDVIFAAYSGREAAEFVRCFRRHGLSGRIRLAGSGFLAEGLDEDTDIISASAWSRHLQTPVNEEFIADASAAGLHPDPFLALGYDTARMIAAAMDEAQGDATALPAILGNLRMESTRGPLAVARKTRSTVTPHYLRCPAGDAGEPMLTRLPSPTALAEHARMRSQRSGLWNSYLTM